MKKIQKTVTFTCITVGMMSCGGWTDKDKAGFIENCENMKFERAYCDCILSDAEAKFSSYEDFSSDQKAMLDILLTEDCLAKDVEITEEQ